MESSGVNTPSPIIDLTIEPKDHLTALPTELQHLIIGYLYPTHEPDKAFHEPESSDHESSGLQKHKSTSHPLDYLAATCRSLRHETMAWSRIFMTKHGDITKYKSLKTAKFQARRNFLRGRGGLLTWSEKNCVFCGKKSSRSAILMNGLRCCAPCDKEQWPEKITKSEAKKQYDLKDHHLLPAKDFAPALAKLLAKHPGGLPKLRYGTYISSNVATTMFLRKDVEALAKFAHGDLKEHLDKKQAARNERKRKDEERKARGEAEAAEMTAKAIELRQQFAAHHQDPLTWFTAPAPEISQEAIADAEEMSMLASEVPFILELAGIDMDDDPFMGMYEPVSVASLC